MKRLAVLAALLATPLAAPAQVRAPGALPGQASGQPAAPSPPDTWLPRQTAELRALDKLNAHVTPLALRIGETVRFGSLAITLRRCAVRPPDQPADSAAFLEVADSRPGAPGFRGWMMADEPSVNMLEHPIYDLRLVACR